MQKKVFIPIILAGLSITFIVICFLLFFKRKSKRLTSAKFKIGGFIIALTATTGCVNYSGCYVISYDGNTHFQHNVGAALDKNLNNKDFVSNAEIEYHIQYGKSRNGFAVYAGPELKSCIPDGNYNKILLGPKLGFKYSLARSSIFTEFSKHYSFTHSEFQNGFRDTEVKLGYGCKMTSNMWTDCFFGYTYTKWENFNASNLTFGIRIIFKYRI